MKKTIMTAMVGVCLVALTSTAAEEGQPKQPSPEQKQFKKEMLSKYDTNKDGKLDKEERANVSEADKQKMKEMRGNKQPKPKKDKPVDE